MKQAAFQQKRSLSGRGRLVHAIFRLLLGLTFLTTIAGAFLSTLGAGVAIPDWPTSFGKIVILYWPVPGIPLLPVAPWEVFLAQLHRFLAGGALVTAGAAAVVAWSVRAGSAVRWAAVVAFLAILFQSACGVYRLWAGAAWSAKLLACSAPLMFLVVFLGNEVVTWSAQGKGGSRACDQRSPPIWVPVLLAGWIYFQIVAGSQLRHAGPTESPYWFLFWVWVHILSGMGLAVATVLAAGFVSSPRRIHSSDSTQADARILLVAILIGTQVLAGVVTWLSRFGVPRWFSDYVASWHLTLENKAPLETLAGTTHVILGIFALAVGGSAVARHLWGRTAEAAADWASQAVCLIWRKEPGMLLAGLGALVAGLVTAAPPNIPLNLLVDTLLAGLFLLGGTASVRREGGTSSLAELPLGWNFSSLAGLLLAVVGVIYFAFAGHAVGAVFALTYTIWALLIAAILPSGVGQAVPMQALLATVPVFVGAGCVGTVMSFPVVLLGLVVFSWHAGFRFLKEPDGWPRQAKSPPELPTNPPALMLAFGAAGHLGLVLAAVGVFALPLGFSLVMAAGATLHAVATLGAYWLSSKKGFEWARLASGWALAGILVGWTLAFLPR